MPYTVQLVDENGRAVAKRLWQPEPRSQTRAHPYAGLPIANTTRKRPMTHQRSSLQYCSSPKTSSPLSLPPITRCITPPPRKPLVRIHSGFSPTSSRSSRSGDYSYLRYASSMSPSEYDYTPSPSLSLSFSSPTSSLSSLSPHTPPPSTLSGLGDHSYLGYPSSVPPSEYDYTPSPPLTVSFSSPTSNLSSLSPHTPPPELYTFEFPMKDIEKDAFDCDLSRHLLELEESMADPFTLIPGYSELESTCDAC